MQLQYHQREFDLYYVDEFLDDYVVFESILRGKGEATIEQVLADKDTDCDHLNRELLDERFKALQEEFRCAVNELLPVVPVEKEHDAWLDFKRGKELPVQHRSVWEWVYDRICEEKRAEAKRAEAATRAKSPYGNLLGPAFEHDDLLRNVRLGNPYVTDLRGVTSAQHEIAHVNVLRDRVERSCAEVRALQQERRLAEELFEATRQPEGFGLALQVLSVLAILGMGIPVIIMGFVPYSLPVWLRVVVMALFFFGVALLLRFLFVYARYLGGARRSLPSWIGGLLHSDQT